VSSCRRPRDAGGVPVTAAARRTRAFQLLWASDTLSVFGAEITMLALPLSAALLLEASAWQMGLLVAAELLPYALLSLHAGALVDRWRRLPLLRRLAFSRALLLAAVPLAAWTGMLSLPLLCALAFALSCLAAFVDLAYQAVLPQIVERERLVRANARLGATQSAAGIVGPAIGGLLVRTLGAPFAFIVDAVAMLVAGLLLQRLKMPEPVPAAVPRALGAEIADGLRIVWRDARLRWAALLLAAWQLLKQAYLAVFVLFALREGGLGAAQVGGVAAMAGVGFLGASVLVERTSARLGLGPTMLAGLLLTTLAWGGAAAARGSPLVLGAALVVEGFGAGLFFLSFVSLRQAVAPPHALARVVASVRFASLAAAPLGAVAGGWLGDAIGLRATIAAVSVAGAAVVVLVAWLSPLRSATECGREGRTIATAC